MTNPSVTSNFLRLQLALMVAAPLAATGAHAAQNGPTSMFVLDVSGSMWGRLPDKQSKISVARTILGKVVTSLPNNVSAGLIAYGHRRRGDCRDIELVQAPKPGAGKAIAARLRTFIPRGKTPITDALKMAGQKLAGTNGPATIVLVSDGIETCKGDPCALAAALAKSNAKLNVHVIGYAVGRKAQNQLQCIAEKGREKYFTANNTKALVDALSRVKKSIVEQKPVEAAPTVSVAQTTTSIKINATGPGTIRLKLPNWTRMPYYWKVLNPETGETIARTTKPSISVLPGQYQIAWRHKQHGSQEVVLPQVIDVKAGQTSDAVVATGLRLVPPKGLRRPYYWQLLPDPSDLKRYYRERQPAAWYSIWASVPVPPGDYTLVLRQIEHGTQESVLGRISLKDGELRTIKLDQGLNLQWPKEWGQIYYLRFVSPDGRDFKMRKRGPIILAPGKYKIYLRRKEHGYTEAAFGEITIPEKGFIDARLTSGISFETSIKGKFYLYAKNLDTGEEARMTNRWGPMPLGPGRYRFELKLRGQKRQTIVPELKIAPGQFVKAKM